MGTLGSIESDEGLRQACSGQIQLVTMYFAIVAKALVSTVFSRQHSATAALYQGLGDRQ